MLAFINFDTKQGHSGSVLIIYSIPYSKWGSLVTDGKLLREKKISLDKQVSHSPTLFYQPCNFYNELHMLSCCHIKKTHTHSNSS